MIKELHQKLVDKKITCQELTEQYLSVIQKKKDLNAFISIDTEGAKKQAKNIDRKIAKGEKISVLAGIPLGVKDAILVKGLKNTAGSKMLANYVAPYDATVIKKIKKAGAVILGKTNLDEFAMGSSGENSAFGPTKNPHDTSLVPGGSSSGSAVSVAAKEVIWALGSDTGGSIRQPASFCGIIGLKPTYGLVSRYGLTAMASSLDQIGVLTQTAEDAAIALNYIAGQDSQDATSLPNPIPDYTVDINKKLKGLTVGLPKEFFGEGLDLEVNQAIETAVADLKKQGVKFKGISLPILDQALAMYYIIMPAEVSANLARFDGLRYGYHTKEDNLDLIATYFKNRAKGFGAEAKRRIMLGNFVLSAGWADEFYKQAQIARQALIQSFEQIWQKVDLILGPTAPTTAYKLGEKTNDPLAMYLGDIYTVPVNLAGLPALSFPLNKTKSKLPIGCHLIGPRFSEAKLLQVAYNYEKSID